jgi:hypothetical protein
MPANEGITANFLENWRGPFAAPHRYRSVYDLLRTRPELFRGESVVGLNPEEGPILVLEADDEDELGDAALQLRSKYPIDPWGNPYLFFGPGRMGNVGGRIAITNETNFNTAVVYSMGPNGLPGDQATGLTDSALYFRETGVLGREGTDDLVREF